MRIRLYDRGSPQGKQLFANLDIVCRRLGVDFDPEYIHDMAKIYSQGVQGKTILTIDGEVALVDQYPSLRELENLVSDYLK